MAFSKPFLCNFVDNVDINGFEEKLREIWSCEWICSFQPGVLDVRHNFGSEILKEFDKSVVLSMAIGCLLAFVQENFVGPRLGEQYSAFLKDHWPKDLNAVEELRVDGEELNLNVKFPEFLLIAEKLVKILGCSSSLVVNWWKLRCVYIHQKILDELTHTLYSEFSEAVEQLMAGLEELDGLELKSLLLVEISLGYLAFHRTQKAEEFLEKACKLLDIELNVEGILGMRTKFQQKPLPQLCLKVQQNVQNQLSPAYETNGKTILPKLLALDDDVLLEKIKFLCEKDNEVMTLPSIIQTIVLAKVKLLLRSQPKDKLADEELEPYIKTLVHQDNGPLPIRLSVLLLNVRQEKDKKRTVERSLKQCEEVLKLIDGEKYSVFDRLSYGFASALVPRWEVQKQLGDLMVSLGLIKTALDLYLEIQEWQEVIECYTRLDLRHKAAEIIRQELEKKPSVKLYCLLGDATNDVSCYETAWKFSKETSSRSQRHWGCYYFAKKDYENALSHLQKSLDINSLQEVIWLRLGYAAIMLEKWELAVHAYITYTHIEPHGFESWNNLAKALIKLGDKKRAHKILGEALKCNYNNWKVWENFMLVSVDTGNFEDVINAYNRLNELKEKFIDLEVMEIVSNAIAKDIPDAQGRPTQRLRKKCNTLLAHQCVQHASEYKLWELAALLAESPLSRAQKLQKCYLTYIHKNTSWSNVKESCLKAVNICKKLCESSLEAIEHHDEAEKSSAMSQLSSARLAVQGCVRNVETHQEEWDELQGNLDDLKSLLHQTTDELKKRM